jgi:hypothetical protein
MSKHRHLERDLLVRDTKGFGRKLNFSLISLKRQTLEKVSLFLEPMFLLNGMDNPTKNLT